MKYSQVEDGKRGKRKRRNEMNEVERRKLLWNVKQEIRGGQDGRKERRF